MEVSRTVLEQIYGDIVNSVGYKTTVPLADRRKVERRLAGGLPVNPPPKSRLGKAAWRVALLLTPVVPTPPPPPPPPPPVKLNPQTYNKGSRGQDARYCVTFDDGFRYDADGREIDGLRSGQFIEGLKPADEMDNRSPCDPYGPFPPWPEKSYER